jgi:hypothetical protein
VSPEGYRKLQKRPTRRKPKPGSARETFWAARLARIEAEKAKEANDDRPTE